MLVIGCIVALFIAGVLVSDFVAMVLVNNGWAECIADQVVNPAIDYRTKGIIGQALFGSEFTIRIEIDPDYASAYTVMAYSRVGDPLHARSSVAVPRRQRYLLRQEEMGRSGCPFENGQRGPAFRCF